MGRNAKLKRGRTMLANYIAGLNNKSIAERLAMLWQYNSKTKKSKRLANKLIKLAEEIQRANESQKLNKEVRADDVAGQPSESNSVG